MIFPRLGFLHRQSDTVVVIELDERTTKAVLLAWSDGGFKLLNYVFLPAPISESGDLTALLADHLRKVIQTLGSNIRHVILSISGGDSLLRHIELPTVPVGDMRRILRLNSVAYLQQDFSDHVFDCFVLSNPHAEKEGIRKSLGSKSKVLIGGTRNQHLKDLLIATRQAGLIAKQITLSQLGSVNAFLSTLKTPLEEIVLFVDVGFLKSTVSILMNLEFFLIREIRIGTQTFIHGLSEALGISHSAAEGAIEVLNEMDFTEKVQLKLQNLASGLADELRASMDFFEKEQGKTVGRIVVSGGSALGNFITQSLETELLIPCKKWSPADLLISALPPEKILEAERDAPQLAVAVGAALAWKNPGLVRMNLLAEQQEAAALSRRDPIRWGSWAAALLILVFFCWGVLLRLKVANADADLKRYERQLASLPKNSKEVMANSRKAGGIERTLACLDQIVSNRFLWASPLNALQFTIGDNIQLIRLKMQEEIVNQAGAKPGTNSNKAASGKLGISTGKITLTLQGKHFGEPPAAERFIESIGSFPYFKENLRNTEPIRLVNISPQRVDPTDSSKAFILFTIECRFAERSFQDE
jgi:Tfp pilus assembly PilM family ATPase